MNIAQFFIINQSENMGLLNLAFRLGFDLAIVAIIILLVYRKHNKNREFIFTLFVFNIIIFVLCTILNNTELSIGSGFGLFAVFTMMRYRSEQINIKDMTYLLIVVALGFLNATYKSQVGVAEVIFINVVVMGILTVLELSILSIYKNLSQQKVKYDKIYLLKPENFGLLRLDLKDRLGIEIQNIKIESINFLENTANLLITGSPLQNSQDSALLPKQTLDKSEVREIQKERILKVGSL